MISKDDKVLLQGLISYARRRAHGIADISWALERASKIIRRNNLAPVITPRHEFERYGAVRAVLNWEGTTVYTGTGTNIFPWR
jgi:hypothetical protein